MVSKFMIGFSTIALPRISPFSQKIWSFSKNQNMLIQGWESNPRPIEGETILTTRQIKHYMFSHPSFMAMGE